ncbi:MAG: hypothetical protein SV377_00895 [Halobacteria archaeon]|nr:hypothetical protein [Halobacteria archaeon]
MDREEAVERVERIIDTVERDKMPVPVREIWVYGDIALGGLNNIRRLNVYVTKDLLLDKNRNKEEEFFEEHGVRGIGRTVSAEWAEEFPEYIRANNNGNAAPERCLGAHLLEEDEPIHLEVCNSSFEDNVTQRLQGAVAQGNYEEILDPRGVCLWIDGKRSETAIEKLRKGEMALPTLENALSMLNLDEKEARKAAESVRAYHNRQEGTSVRGDVV